MSEPSSVVVRHHRLRNIVLSIVVVPICLFIALIAAGFVINIVDQSTRIRQGDYSLPESPDTSPRTTRADYTAERRALIEGTNNPYIGASQPKVTIVEFGDFACPFCLASFPAVREIGLKYKDSVKIIFRNWPGHEHSVNLAVGAQCAGEQGKFWEMHDKLFQSQSDTFGSDKNDLARLAQQLGIYNEQFQKCFDGQTYLARIKSDFIDSETLGVTGTPTWFVNGVKYSGQLNAPELEEIISSALNAQ